MRGSYSWPMTAGCRLHPLCSLHALISDDGDSSMPPGRQFEVVGFVFGYQCPAQPRYFTVGPEQHRLACGLSTRKYIKSVEQRLRIQFLRSAIHPAPAQPAVVGHEHKPGVRRGVELYYER